MWLSHVLRGRTFDAEFDADIRTFFSEFYHLELTDPPAPIPHAVASREDHDRHVNECLEKGREAKLRNDQRRHDQSYGEERSSDWNPYAYGRDPGCRITVHVCLRLLAANDFLYAVCQAGFALNQLSRRHKTGIDLAPVLTEGAMNNLKRRYLDSERGAIGYILAWLMGVPAIVLFAIFLLRGCD